MRKVILVYFGNIWKKEHFARTEHKLEEEGQISVFSFMIVKQYCMFQKKYQICQTSCINRAKHIFLCEVK